jgi:uncharacterized protein (DUF1778 family)
MSQTKRAPTSVVFRGRELQRLKRAAALKEVSVSRFLRDASVEAAEKILAEHAEHTGRCPVCGKSARAA